MSWDADGDVEDIHRYTKEGFLPIRLGDVFSSTQSHYQVCTNSDKVPFQQYGWQRLSSRREPIRHSSTLLIIFLQAPICRSQDLCSTCRSKARTLNLHPALRYAECTAASRPLFIAGAERCAHCPPV